jgi:hypothetical protein
MLFPSGSDNKILVTVKRALIVIGAIIGLLVAWNFVSRILPSSIEYRGEKIRLTRYYLDYDEYKNDPDNIDPSETARVQRLVTEAPIGRSYDTRLEMIRATSDLTFPGYGAGSLGDGLNGEGSLSGLSIEIPRADKSRYLLFQCRGGKYALIDDFVDSDPLLMLVQRQQAQLLYSSYEGKKKLVRVPKYP